MQNNSMTHYERGSQSIKKFPFCKNTRGKFQNLPGLKIREHRLLIFACRPVCTAMISAPILHALYRVTHNAQTLIN